MLYALARRAAQRVTDGRVTIVETGTARGFSALCMTKGLADAGASGLVMTVDVLPHDRPIYWNCYRDAEGRRTRAQLLEAYRDLLERYVVFLRGDSPRVLARVSVPRVHLAVLDSVHTYEHVQAEWAALHGRQQAGDVLFFDDYTPEQYPGVVQAADEICARGGYVPTVITAAARRRYLVAEKR